MMIRTTSELRFGAIVPGWVSMSSASRPGYIAMSRSFGEVDLGSI
jgi:hypothetical protein